MSKGIGAHANLILRDEKTVIYEYGSYNLNIDGRENKNHIYDGIITIEKSCFIEPEIHEKLKRMPNGRKKLTTKRVLLPVAYPQMIKQGKIKIENCSNCWSTTPDERRIDIMVLRILFKLFNTYQEEGKIPESVSYNV